MILTSFAQKHAKNMCPCIDDVLERFTIERILLDIFEEIKYREYMIFEDYQKMIYLKVPFLDMLCKYKKITPVIALNLIRREYATYDNLIEIFEFHIYG